jgi:YVTN family beta-propeller protein
MIACRVSELSAPDRNVAVGPRASFSSAPSTEKFAAYISDAGTSSVLVVGETNHDTIVVIPVGATPGASAGSPDGARVYVVLSGQQLAVIKTSDNTLVAKIPLLGTGATGVVVSPDSKTVYVANRGGTISVVDAGTLTLLAPIPVGGITPYMLDISPDGKHLYVGDNVGYWMAIVNTGTRAIEAAPGIGYRSWSVGASPDGQFVYSATNDGVERLRTSTNSVDFSFGFPGTPVGLAVAPDNLHVFVAVHDQNVVRVLNVQTTGWTLVPLANAYLPKVSADGRWVYVTQPESHSITVLDAQTFAASATIPVTNPQGVSFAPVATSVPTTTSITSSVQPSVSGQVTQFTATVTGNGSPVTTGQLFFRLGGTSCADALTFAGPLSLDANGKGTASRDFMASGSPFVVRACYDGTATASHFLSSEGAVTQTVNPARVDVIAAVTPSTQQYSDKLVLSAQLGLEAGSLDGQTLTGTVTFSLGGVPVGSMPVKAATLPATITLPPYVVGVPAGGYSVGASFTSTNANFTPGTATGATATIAAEDAVVMPDPTFPTELRVTTPLGVSGVLTFAFTVSELSPETNADQSLTAPGDLALTAANVVLTPAHAGAPVTVACTAGSVAGSGYAQTRHFTCANGGLPADNYQVLLQLIPTASGSYYAGSSVRALRVYDPSAETIALERTIAALVQAGTLNHGNGNALTSKLDEVTAKIARGDDHAAINQLGAFVNQVEALPLPAEICDQLTAAARGIAADLAK